MYLLERCATKSSNTHLLLIDVEHEEALGHAGAAAARLADRFRLQKVLLQQFVRVQLRLFSRYHRLSLDLLLLDVILLAHHTVDIRYAISILGTR